MFNTTTTTNDFFWNAEVEAAVRSAAIRFGVPAKDVVMAAHNVVDYINDVAGDAELESIDKDGYLTVGVKAAELIVTLDFATDGSI